MIIILQFSHSWPVWCYLTPIITFTIIYTLPRFWELEVILDMCGTPQARAPELGTGPKERMAGPRGMDPLGPVPEYLILHHSWARGVFQ